MVTNQALVLALSRARLMRSCTRVSRTVRARTIDITTHNKIVVITGATAGIGFATALGLAKQGATIVWICRNANRGHIALKAVAEVATATPRLLIADLSSQASIRELSASLHEQLPRIDVLINNVGAAFAKREYTVDGIGKTLPSIISHGSC